MCVKCLWMKTWMGVWREFHVGYVVKRCFKLYTHSLNSRNPCLLEFCTHRSNDSNPCCSLHRAKHESNEQLICIWVREGKCLPWWWWSWSRACWHRAPSLLVVLICRGWVQVSQVRNSPSPSLDDVESSVVWLLERLDVSPIGTKGTLNWVPMSISFVGGSWVSCTSSSSSEFRSEYGSEWRGAMECVGAGASLCSRSLSSNLQVKRNLQGSTN